MMQHTTRKPNFRRGFTLIELLISMVILVILIGVVGLTVRGISGLNRATVAKIETTQLAQNIFDQIERDLTSVSPEMFLLIRQEGIRDPVDFDGTGVTNSDIDNNRGINLKVRNEDGEDMQISVGRTDWLAMVTTGDFVAQSDAVASTGNPYAGLPSHAARVIYAHTNSVLGNQSSNWQDSPHLWATNWKLVRQQTLLTPLLSEFDLDGVAGVDFPNGDGSLSAGSPYAPVAADVADLSLGDLLGYQVSATSDFVHNGSSLDTGGKAPGTNTGYDWDAEKPEVAILRVKRDDLSQAQIYGNNPDSTYPEDTANSKFGVLPGWYSIQTRPDGSRFSEGYQRPRILSQADLGGTGEDLTMYGRIIAPKCPHFRIDYTFGDVNERGEIFWARPIPWQANSKTDLQPRHRESRMFETSVAFSGVSARTMRSEVQRGMMTTGSNRTTDSLRWPVAIRVQLVLVDSVGHDEVGHLYSRVIPIAR